MTIDSFLAPERCIFLERQEKQDVIAELVAALWRSKPQLEYTGIFNAIWEREVQFTTRISAEIAMPHAQIPGMKETYICVGLSKPGITYDPKDQSLVKLVFLVVGSPEQHLKVLSTLARYLMDEEIVHELLEAPSPKALYELLTKDSQEDPLTPKEVDNQNSTDSKTLSQDQPGKSETNDNTSTDESKKSDSWSSGSRGKKTKHPSHAFTPEEREKIRQEALLLGLDEEQQRGYELAKVLAAKGPSQSRIILESALRVALSLEAASLFIHTKEEQEIRSWYERARETRGRDIRDTPATKSQKGSKTPQSPDISEYDDLSLDIPFPNLVIVENSPRFSVDEAEPDTPTWLNYLNMPYRQSGKTSPVNLALLIGLSKNIIHKGQKVVSVFHSSGEDFDSLEVTDLDRDFGVFFSMPFRDSSTDTQMEVFMRVLQIATELATEGREGKPVGTVFVLGAADQVAQYTQQMVVNPFRGYDEAERNILDPSLTETLKEFSRIDGAIIIKGNGVIVSAGTYLRVDRPVEPLPAGLGARHTAAAGITAVSQAISLAISESTRQVSIFYGGSRVMVL